jgi:DNA-binding CsgD family transcriptional regulator
MDKVTFLKSLTPNQRVSLLVSILGGAWVEWFFLDAELWRKLLLSTSNQPQTAKIIYCSAYCLSLFLFSFRVKAANVKKTAVTGMAADLFLSILMLLRPEGSFYYALSGLLGAATGQYFAALIHIFTFSFNPENKITIISFWVLSTYALALITAKLLRLLGIEFSFLLSAISLIAAIVLIWRFKPEQLYSADAAPKYPYPKSLLTAFGLILAFYYFIGYLSKNTVNTQIFSLDDGVWAWLANSARFATFYLFYKLGKKSNLLTVIYLSLICTVLAYVFGILPEPFALTANIFFGIAGALGAIFIYSLITDIAFKYSRNRYVLSVLILIANIAFITGYYCGLKVGVLFQNHQISLYGILLVLSCSLLLVLPWLFRSIGRELDLDFKFLAERENTASSINHARLLELNKSLEVDLTERELEIAALLMERYDYQSIAAQMQISVNTLKVHARNIYRKFKVTGRKELVRLVQRG